MLVDSFNYGYDKEYQQYKALAIKQGERPATKEQFIEALRAQYAQQNGGGIELEMAMQKVAAQRSKQKEMERSWSEAATESGKEHIEKVRALWDKSKETTVLTEEERRAQALERYEKYKQAWWAELKAHLGHAPKLKRAAMRTIAYIIAWFARLDRFDFPNAATGECETIDVELGKGLWITGASGVGKTTTMEIMRKVTHSFAMVSMNKIATECLNAGDITPITERIRGKVYCFDDVGSENKVKLYGNDVEPFSQVVLLYEEQTRQGGLPVLATSNISPVRIVNGEIVRNEAFQARYGERETNRIIKLFSVLYMDGECNWLK